MTGWQWRKGKIDGRSGFTIVAAALWLVVTLYETIRPVDQVTPVSFWSVWVEMMAGVDAVQNIVLFLPMGWIARRAGWPVWRSVLTAALLSAGIEFAQQWIPGRTSTAMDIASNTAGAALGWWMATAVRRPRLRAILSTTALAGFLGLHVLNTMWPDAVARVDDGGKGTGIVSRPCAPPVRSSAVCLSIPGSATAADLFVLAVGPEERTYARVQSPAFGRPIRGGDCVTASFESTIGVNLGFRPPVTRACGFVARADGAIAMIVDPRIERTVRGTWEPTRAGVWMWPVWPFDSYRPSLLRVVGALTFVIGTALLAGAAFWWIPCAYVLLLALVALVSGMGGPGWWDVGWAAVGWVVATGAVALDGWWRRRNS